MKLGQQVVLPPATQTSEMGPIGPMMVLEYKCLLNIKTLDV